MRNTLPGTAVAAPRVRRATLVGTVFDRRYEVIAKIAAGGFGAIYRAVDLTNGIEVALKVLHAELASDASLAARFRREAEMLAMLRDPRTVQTFGAGETDDGTLYIALELLHGESLEQRMERGKLGWREVLAILREVCSSMSEAHDRGIVHRDLKPGNVFLGAEGVKVLDFGIAKLESGAPGGDAQLTRIGQAIGTLDYMAPEQLVGGECDARTDIYTLGIVAYEAITGQRPFADAVGATGLITALLTMTPLAPSMRVPVVPNELDDLVLRCLEREPDDRFASMRELADAIDELLGTYQESTAVDHVLPQFGRGSLVEVAPLATSGLAIDPTDPMPRVELSSVELPAVPVVRVLASRGHGVIPAAVPATLPLAAPSLRMRQCLTSRIAIAAAVALASGFAWFAIT